MHAIKLCLPFVCFNFESDKCLIVSFLSFFLNKDELKIDIKCLFFGLTSLVLGAEGRKVEIRHIAR